MIFANFVLTDCTFLFSYKVKHVLGLRGNKKIESKIGVGPTKREAEFMIQRFQFMFCDANRSIKACDKYYVMTLANGAINLRFTLAVKLIT